MDLSKKIADEVFGWKLYHPEMESGDHFSARGDDFKWGLVKSRYPNGMTEDEWRPHLSIRQAYLVIDKMRELGFRMARVEYSDGIYLKFSENKLDDEEFNVSQITPDKEPEGICRAALYAIRRRYAF